MKAIRHLDRQAAPESDSVVRFFSKAVRRVLGSRLRQIVLFGSRARGDARPDSDYDLLVVVDRVDKGVTHDIDEIAGQVLLDYGAVLSAFSISEEDRGKRPFSPLLINISREGLTV